LGPISETKHPIGVTVAPRLKISRGSEIYQNQIQTRLNFRGY
jgi:hypothetical protein